MIQLATIKASKTPPRK